MLVFVCLQVLFVFCFFQKRKFYVKLSKDGSRLLEKHQVHKGALRQQFLVFPRTKV